MVFVVTGLFSATFFTGTFEACKDFVMGNSGMIYRVQKFQKRIEENSQTGLMYHDKMIDLNSLKDYLLGTKVIVKDDTTVAKTDSGSLIQAEPKIPVEDIDSTVSEIEKLKTVSENNGASFLYCVAPSKELYQVAPPNVENYEPENYGCFLRGLSDAGIPYIELGKALIEKGLDTSEMFYYTDHHWTARCGFTANKILCEELGKRYGFEYTEQYTDIDNYNITEYENWFLGSNGKKVGLYFSGKGADDFELITPKFKTDLIEQQPLKGQIRKGDFQNTVIFKKNLEKDFHKSNTYSTYSGGDFHLQIITNNFNPQGKKILIIRDSFASVVTPFLSLQTSELHICDMRNFGGMVGEKINVEEYIKEINPDYVLVLFSGISSSDFEYDKFVFF